MLRFLSLFTLCSAPTLAQGSITPELFVTLGVQLTTNPWERPEVSDVRAVAVRTDLLESSAQRDARRFLLSGFGGETLVLGLEAPQPTESGGQLWRGAIEGRAWSQVLLVVHGESVAACIRYDDTLLELAADPGLPGVHVLTQLDSEQFDACGVGAAHHVHTPGVGGAGSPLDGPAANLVADVLVVYSPEVRAARGGTNPMLALIDLAVAETNQAYSNSQMDLRLRLVGTLETAQAETADMNQVLSRLRSRTDGWYDEAHTVRDQVGADLVTMLTDAGQYCGLGYLMTNVSVGFASNAFSVTKASCATGNLTFGHELGHNMGCAHDRANAGNAAYDYSYGYRTSDSAFRTVMAYAPGMRIPYFSTPNVLYQGRVLGIADPSPNSADNARGLDEAGPTIARWRCAVPVAYGDGTTTSLFQELTLGWSGEPSAGGSGNFRAEVTNGIPGQFGLVFYGFDSFDAPFFGGSLYVGMPLVRMPPQQVSALGTASFDWMAQAQPMIGETYYLQFWQRDPAGTPGGQIVALSNGLRVDVCE